MSLPSSGPRILVLDIETAPAVVETWGLHGVYINVNQIQAPGYVLGFGAKWVGEKAIRWYDRRTGDLEFAAFDQLDRADLVITYNGDSFDLKHLNREIVLGGLNPPSPYKSVDLYKVVKRHFKFQSNKLGYVTEQLGVGSKASTGGYDLWKRCMAGDEKAWRKLASYCKQDVRVTEALYNCLLPWISNHPNVNLWSDATGYTCPRCGSTSVQKQGTRVALSMVYQRYQCQACSSWSHDVKGERVGGELRSA